MVFVQKIIKIGNSLGIIIPKALIDYLGWEVGTEVDISYNSQKKAIIAEDKTGQGIRITKKLTKN